MSKAANLSTEARKFMRQAIVVAVVTMAGIGFATGQAAVATSSSSSASFEYITVQSGQSLWSLASQYAPNQDPRDWIAQVVSLNALTQAEVQPGQQIALP
jgi:LysM repeat protein